MIPTVQDAPTYAYVRIRYGSPAIVRSFRVPGLNYLTPMLAERGEGRTSDGHTEYLFGRIEETARVDLMCEPDELQQLRWFFQDWAARGKQSELWIDRLTGSIWTFDDSLRDQNLLNLVLSTGSAAYADTVNGRGIVLGSGQYLSVALAQSSASPITGYDDPLSKDEGVLVLDFKPTYPANDGSLHVLVDTSSGGTNRLQLRKTATGDLVLEVTDGTGTLRSVAGAGAWSAADRVRIVARWGIPPGSAAAGLYGLAALFGNWSGSSGPLALWYAVNSGAWTALTTAAGSGSGTMQLLPTTLYVGATNAGANAALGTYDTVAIFKRAFASPLQVADYRPTWRNYFPYFELQKAWQPQRVTPGRAIFTWPILGRNGLP